MKTRTHTAGLVLNPFTTDAWRVITGALLAATFAARVAAGLDTGIIETVAGGHVGDGGSAMQAVVDPHGLALCARVPDMPPDLYIADGKGNRIRKVDGSTGTISTVAGTGTAGFAGDGGPAGDAQLSFPLDVACDASGNVYVADGWGNRRVRKIDTNGAITTVAGNGQRDFSGDNVLATQTGLIPYALATDAAGNVYVADADNRRVRRIGADGVIRTVAGNGTYGSARDGGVATEESLAFPTGVAVDTAGNLYIVDYSMNVVYRVAAGRIARFAGDGSAGFAGDGGPATSARLSMPKRVAVDRLGNVLILDAGNNRVRRVAPDGVISTIAGDGMMGSEGDGGPATQARFFPLRGIASDADDNVYVGTSADTSEPWSYDNRVRLIDASGKITTVVGLASNGDGSAPLDAVTNPQGLATFAGTLYIADAKNNQLRKLDTDSGVVSTVAGNGVGGFSGDGGPAVAAQLLTPSDVAVDANGVVYIADQNNNRVRRVDARGDISTVAGNGSFGYNGDVARAIDATLASPSGIDVDAAGNLYVADRYNQRVRVVTPEGTIATVAGTGSFNPFAPSGDGGAATEAQVAMPTDVAAVADGMLYIAESGMHRVRKVMPNGVIVTVAGNGVAGFSGDGGPAVDAQLSAPYRLALDAQGNLYVADADNLRVRRINTATGVITTVAGNGLPGVGGDGGPAIDAQLYAPMGVAVDAAAHLYIAQADSSRVRMVRVEQPAAPPTPTPTQTNVPPTSTPTQAPTPTTPPAAAPLAMVAGRVHYHGSGFEVPDAAVEMKPLAVGGTVMQTATDTAGRFTMEHLATGGWQLQASKQGGAGNGVSAADAVHALRVAAGLKDVGPDGMLACDVSADGVLTQADAMRILQRRVGAIQRFPVAQLCGSDWLFMPEPAPMAGQTVTMPRVAAGTCNPGGVTFGSLVGEAMHQDFSAMVFGDCAGDWRPQGVAGSAEVAAPVEVGRLQRLRKTARLSLRVRGRGMFHALEARLEYDPAVLAVPRLRALGTARGALVALNVTEPGSVTIAVASAAPWRSGRVLTLEFDVPSTRPGTNSVRVVAGSATQVQ